MTTKERSATASKGLPVNHCSGFRSPFASNDTSVDGIAKGILWSKISSIRVKLNIDSLSLSLSPGILRENFSIDVNAKDYGFEPTDTPRTDRSVLRNIQLGIAALSGEKGPAYDRIVLNAGMVDHLLGCSGAEDVHSALDRAREAMDSGKALKRLMNYMKISHKV